MCKRNICHISKKYDKLPDTFHRPHNLYVFSLCTLSDSIMHVNYQCWLYFLTPKRNDAFCFLDNNAKRFTLHKVLYIYAWFLVLCVILLFCCQWLFFIHTKLCIKSQSGEIMIHVGDSGWSYQTSSIHEFLIDPRNNLYSLYAYRGLISCQKHFMSIRPQLEQTTDVYVAYRSSSNKCSVPQ